MLRGLLWTFDLVLSVHHLPNTFEYSHWPHCVRLPILYHLKLVAKPAKKMINKKIDHLKADLAHEAPKHQ